MLISVLEDSIDASLGETETSLRLDAASVSQFDVLTLPDPCTGQERVYLSPISSSKICEIQVISPTEYSSALLLNSKTVVAGAQLTAISPVDPLFWLLSVSPTNRHQYQWEPLSQIQSRIHPAIVEAIEEPQYKHFFATFLDDSSFYYKFQTARALSWLDAKQRNVLASMTQAAESSATLKNGETAAFADSFVLSEQTTNEAQQIQTSENAGNSSQVLHESIQIVCNYLNPEWRKAWVEGHLKMSVDAIERKHKPRLPTVADTSEWSAPVEDLKKRKVAGATLEKNKKLAKGMQKLSAFFSIKNK